MRLNKKQLTKLNKVNNFNDQLITKDGISFVRGATKKSKVYIEVGYYTDLPDSEIDLTQLKQIITRLKGANVSQKEGKLNFQTEKVSLDIKSESVEETDPLETEGEVIGELNTQMLKGFAKFCGKDELRPSMQGVNFNKDGICATDAHTMKFDMENTWDNTELNIPFDVIDLMLEEEYQLVKQDDNTFVLKGDNQIILFKNTEIGNYPQWLDVLPEEYPYTIELDSNEIKKELKFLKTINLKTVLHDNKIIAEDEDLETKAEVSINGNFDFGEKLGFNTEYLLKIVQDCKGNITLYIDSANRAVIVKDEDDQTFLIMPIMLKK